VAHDFVFGAPAMARAVGGFGIIFQGASPDTSTVGYCTQFLVNGQLTLADVAPVFAASTPFITWASSTVA
jgi:hypothetical protein